MKKKSVLIVEDNVELCNSIILSLDKAGYLPTGCVDMREAMFRLKNEKYSAILLDIRLGGDSGEELLDFIRGRKDSYNKEAPIVIISGYLDKPLVKRIAGRVQGALVKPFSMKLLLEQLDKVIT